MFDTIKNSLFTLSGLITSIIHLMLIVGVIASYLFFRIEFLGEDASISFPSATAMKGRIK